MRMLLAVVGVLAWVWALAVLWVFKENGGASTVIAAGIFAIVAILALGFERVLKMLEDIRDGSVTQIRVSPSSAIEPTEVEVRSEPLQAPLA